MASLRLRLPAIVSTIAFAGCSLAVDTSGLTGGAGATDAGGDTSAPNDSSTPDDSTPADTSADDSTSPFDTSVDANGDLQIDPTNPTVLALGTIAFKANQAVTWSVLDAGGGSITGDGTYTAPATAGSYHVRATSVANPSLHVDTTVTVQVAVAPGTIVTGINDANATGHGSQTHVVRAPDTGEWWVFYHASTSGLATMHSKTFAAWAAGESVTLPKGNSGDGRDLDVAFAVLNAHDVVHLTDGYSNGSNGRYHLRAVLTDGHCTFGVPHEINSGGDSTPDGSSTAIMPDGTVFDVTGWQDTPSTPPLSPCGNGDVDTYQSTVVDNGTTSFDTVTFKNTVLWCVPSYVDAKELVPIGTSLFNFYVDGIDSGNPKNLLFSRRDASGTWYPVQNPSGSAVTPPKAFGADKTFGLDDWAATTQGGKAHVVRRTVTGFDHAVINVDGTFGAGAAIPSHDAIANSGLFLAPYGAGVVLAEIAGDNSIVYTSYNGSSWSAWATLVPATSNARGALSGGAPSGVSPVVLWTEANPGGGYVIAGAKLP